MGKRWRWLAAGAVLAAACGDPLSPTGDADAALQEGAAARVELNVDRDAYSRGDLVAAELSNDGQAPLGYNTCLAAFDAWTPSGWRRIDPLRVCTAAIYTLEGGESVTFEEATADLAPGRYRLVLKVVLLDDEVGVTIASRGFEVEP